MKIVSVSTMRALDAEAIRRGTDGMTLMQRAGEGVFREMMAFLAQRLNPVHWRSIAVLTGKGNNAGDGFVVARLIAEQTDLSVTVYAVCPVAQLSGAARAHAERLPSRVPLRVCEALPEAVCAPGTVIVDALLGTGMHGSLRAPYERLIAQVNASGCPVVSVDVPSGIDGDSGAAASDAVVADLTVTLGLPKPGLFARQGVHCCGLLRCVDIGFSAELCREAPAAGEAVFADDISALLGRRPRAGHKGTFGRVLVLGGSRLYGGAPFLAGEAALRVGAGLALVGIPGAAPLACRAPAAVIVRALPEDADGFLGACSRKAVAALLDMADAVVFGPGLGPAPDAAGLFLDLVRVAPRLVIDADGLRVLAAHPTEMPAAGAEVVLTPHPGEMRCLLAGYGLHECLEKTRTQQAAALAKASGAHVVLKGAATVVAAPGGACALNSSGSVALATAGTGDVLAGMIGGFLAAGMSAWDAARAAVFVHGSVAEVAPGNGRSLIADDLLAGIGPALSLLTPFD